MLIIYTSYIGTGTDTANKMPKIGTLELIFPQWNRGCHGPRVAPPSVHTNHRPDDAPARNTRCQVQHCTITQEAILACLDMCSFITSRSLTPTNAAYRSFPTDFLNAVLD